MASKSAEDHETGQQSQPAQAPGFGMRMAISGISKKFSTVKNIATDQLHAWMTSKPCQPSTQGQTTPATLEGQLVLLDTRPVEEYRVGHIPGSVQVDYQQKPQEVVTAVTQLQVQSPEERKTVVCYCSVGYRSSAMAEKLEAFYKSQGVSSGIKVYNLEGSIFKWANENRPMVDANDQKTVYTHPYNAVFGKLLNKEYRKSDL